MQARLPTLFVSHGAPTMALAEDETTRFLQDLGEQIPQPEAVICMSAHWATGTTSVSSGGQPATMHDFSGFGARLNACEYPSPGDPALAARVCDALQGAGIDAGRDSRRGLDHGVWVPLKWMYPQANVPVVCVSVVPSGGPAHQYAVGAALREFAARGCLLLGSGGTTHNLAAVNFQQPDAPAHTLAADFEGWLTEQVTRGATQELLAYRARAPGAVWNHPSDEHLLPLFFALGAARDPAGECVHRRITFEVLSLSAFRWQ
ncbi:MAG: dioxygenase [Gammaproteobacteria bacterium]|nr:dioxygenase [Gammaproteobacteria bacterium]